MFAIFYNMNDLAPLVASLNLPLAQLTAAERREAGRYWTGGLSSWQTAPLAPEAFNRGDLDCRILVISYGTKAGLITLLRRIAQLEPTAEFMFAIAGDMEGEGAIDPWPPA